MQVDTDNMDELREALIARNFTVTANYAPGKDNLTQWYAWRRSGIPARECECNEGKPAQIVVSPHHYMLADGRRFQSCEIALTGEADGTWFRLAAWHVSLDGK